MRSLLADPAFDYSAYGAASTKIVLGTANEYLTLPAYQLTSATLVEYQSGTNPSVIYRAGRNRSGRPARTVACIVRAVGRIARATA
jgi:hypothetical protein